MDLNRRFTLSHNYQPNVNFEVLKIEAVEVIEFELFIFAQYRYDWLEIL